jgi:hypothetical protein
MRQLAGFAPNNALLYGPGQFTGGYSAYQSKAWRNQ